MIDVDKLTTRAKHAPVPCLVQIARAATLPTPGSVQRGHKKNRYNKFEWKNKCHYLKPGDRRETRSGAVAGKSYATAVNVSTTNASVQTDLTWPNGADRLKKVSDIEKAQKQTTKAVQKQRTSVASQASLDSLNSHEICTSRQPRQSKPASKQTKSHQRSAFLNRKKPETDVCSGRLKKAEQHLIPISNSYNTLADLADEGMDICQEGLFKK